MSLWKVARDRGNQIARELNLRKSSELVHPHNRRIFDRTMADIARTPNAPARSRLDYLFHQVRRRRELQTAVALLDLAWQVPPDTRLEEDVVLMIRRCYLDAPQVGWQLRIRDELRDRQVHPFPSVRRVVHLVRQIDPVDAVELAEIGDLERGYPDLRQSIAERIVLHHQVEHLESAIAYLSAALQQQGTDPGEEEAATRIFSQLAWNFQKSERALEILYRTYLDSYESLEPRGFLMLALAGYGDAIVPQLVFHHGDNTRDRPAIEHVLMQIMARGGVDATKALLTILVDSPTHDVPRICNFLSKGLSTLAGQPGFNAAAVQEVVVDSVPTLERRRHPEVQRFLKEFSSLGWGVATLSVLIQRVLDGSATESERQQIRRLSRPATRVLIGIAEDVERGTTERRRALEALATLRSAARPGLSERLLRILVEADADDVRVGVLRVLAALKLDPGPVARDVLFQLLQDGSPKLVAEIRAAWSRMFRAVGVTDDVRIAEEPS